MAIPIKIKNLPRATAAAVDDDLVVDQKDATKSITAEKFITSLGILRGSDLDKITNAILTKPVYFEVKTPTSTLTLPEGDFVYNVRSIYVSSARQAVGYGFTFNKDTRVVTLAQEITQEQISQAEDGYILIEVICDVYSSDDPTNLPAIIASNQGAGKVGTESGKTVQEELEDIRNSVGKTIAVMFNAGSPVGAGLSEFLVPGVLESVQTILFGGVMQYLGVHFTYSPATRIVKLLGAETLGGEIVIFHGSYNTVEAILPNALSGISFAGGGVLSSVNDQVYDPTNQTWWFWTGAYPKIVSAGDKPSGEGWVSVGANDEIEEIRTFSRNLPGRVNPRPQKHDFAWVAAQFRETPNVLILNPGTSLQSVEFSIPTKKDTDVTFRIRVSGVKASHDFNAGQTLGVGVHCVASVSTDLDRTGLAQRTGSMTYDGSILEVTIDASRNTTGFANVSIRLAANAFESLQVYDIYALQEGLLIGRLPLFKLPPRSLWNGASRLTTSVTGMGLDFGVDLLLNVNSRFECNDFTTSHPGASMVDITSRLWGLELNRKWAAKFTQFSKWYLVSGEHYTYRRTASMSFTKESVVYGEPGATVMGGKQLNASGNPLGLFSGGYVFGSEYDYDSNPDSTIRAGTKVPWVAIRVPATKTNSMRSYSLTAVASLDAVKATAYSRWYDYANKMMYFNWGTGNDNAYIYVPEVDNCISSTASLYVAGVTFWAAKTDTVKVQPSSYSSNNFAGFYQCTAGVAVGGNGAFSMNYIDSELIRCTADSHLNDGFNFHYSGTSLIKESVSRCNGDDGISHHESCVGYVVNTDMNYNYAACSVPAFGATVYHYNCNAMPPIKISSKNYSGKYAAISGQDQNTIAYYEDCYINGRGAISEYYHASSQQTGTSVKMSIINPSTNGRGIPLFARTGDLSLVDVQLSLAENF